MWADFTCAFSRLSARRTHNRCRSGSRALHRRWPSQDLRPATRIAGELRSNILISNYLMIACKQPRLAAEWAAVHTMKGVHI